MPPPPFIAPPPEVRLVHVEELSSVANAFVGVRNLSVRVSYPDGTESAPFRYDLVTRRFTDAVVIVATFVKGGVRSLYLRSCLRVPIAMRTEAPIVDRPIWEMPAGLIDDGETPEAAARRELEEELGFSVSPGAIRRLGPWNVPAPALIGEVQHYFVADVSPDERGIPSEDGSALERHAGIVSLTLDEALDLVRAGGVVDGKSELAIRRLADHVLLERPE